MKISENITYDEAVKSISAKKLNISNIPTPEQLENIKVIASKIFEPLRAGLGGKPIYISSFFRSVELNASKQIGGSETSQHCALKGRGAAMDLDGHVYMNHSNAQIFNYILKHLEFDQLIWELGTAAEPDWVHVSFNPDKNRHQVLRSIKEKNKTKYLAL